MDQPQQPKEPKNKKSVRISISELDKTVIDLHNLFQGDQVVISLVLTLSKQNKKVVRTFRILDCFSTGGNEDFKRPDYLG